MYAWGRNTEGQLGLGDNIERKKPDLVRIPKEKRVSSIFCGGHFTGALFTP